jgi:hypothetical protein
MKEIFRVVCLLWRFEVTSIRHVHCLFFKVFVTIYGNCWYCYQWTSYVNPISPIVKTLCEAFFLRAWSTTDLYSIVWRLSDPEFDKLNFSFYFFIKMSIVIPRERSHMGCYLFCWERFSSISCLEQSVYCHRPRSLVVQFVGPYALVMLSLQWIPNRYMFYLNILSLYLLLLILNLWGRFLLSFSF